MQFFSLLDDKVMMISSEDIVRDRLWILTVAMRTCEMTENGIDTNMPMAICEYNDA